MLPRQGPFRPCFVRASARALFERALTDARGARALLQRQCDDGGLSNVLGGPLAIDLTRARRLARAGFEVRLSTIAPDITPMNRLLVAWPVELSDGPSAGWPEDEGECARSARDGAACQQGHSTLHAGGTSHALPQVALPESPWARWKR